MQTWSPGGEADILNCCHLGILGYSVSCLRNVVVTEKPPPSLPICTYHHRASATDKIRNGLDISRKTTALVYLHLIRIAESPNITARKGIKDLPFTLEIQVLEKEGGLPMACTAVRTRTPGSQLPGYALFWEPLQTSLFS